MCKAKKSSAAKKELRTDGNNRMEEPGRRFCWFRILLECDSVRIPDALTGQVGAIGSGPSYIDGNSFFSLPIGCSVSTLRQGVVFPRPLERDRVLKVVDEVPLVIDVDEIKAERPCGFFEAATATAVLALATHAVGGGSRRR